MDASGRKGRISESEMLDSNEGMLDVWGQKESEQNGTTRAAEGERRERERERARFRG